MGAIVNVLNQVESGFGNGSACCGQVSLANIGAIPNQVAIKNQLGHCAQ